MNSGPNFFLRVLVTYFLSFENQFIPRSKNVISKLNFSTIKYNLYISVVSSTNPTNLSFYYSFYVIA